jgi:toxin ParE1/3/4
VRALRDLRTQRAYIARTQPAAAQREARQIISATDRLAIYPEYGRLATWDATGRLRELVVAGTPFVVLYTLGPESIIIVRVLHGAQRRRP